MAPKTKTTTAATDTPPVFLAERIRIRELGELRGYQDNPRGHPERQLDALAAAFRRYGFLIPALVKGDDIVDGHGRVLAATRAGLARIPTIDVAHLSDDQVRELRVSINRLSDLGEFDDEKLARELAAIEAATRARGEDLDASLGFSDAEIAKLVAELEPSDPAKLEGAEAPRLPVYQTVERVTRDGDLWLLGPHRLVCGDSRLPATVARVTKGAPIPLLVSDPPYCSGSYQEAGRSAGTWGDIAGDNLSTKGYQTLIREVLAATKPTATYVFTDWRMWPQLVDVVEASGVAVRSMIVWRKPSPGMGSLWRTQHELILFGSRRGARRRKGQEAFGNVVDGAEREGFGDVLDVARVRNVHHYTEKPVELMRRLLAGDEVSDRRRCPVYDGFAGGGATLIAAHLEGRVFHGSEIEPRWIDVILERWRSIDGAPEPVLEGGGTWSETRAERGTVSDAPTPRPSKGRGKARA